ncbi:type II toxin-antitoxin system RnlA family toxin [Pseudomonas sp. PDM09]|uniref:type II toxin-antitoxin system RnlA family toxin n=1 Tax=Pseudomonas sp. PDM09 TaxID=2769270 RepID=UPI00177FF625|nr:type II toxin-antitoxin system RnlA family toxin [Pseudomonas sp. PDM09]MBD9565283.1 type II toxin-antitoxin system RnlA family toxin [Pseudomonas sp. PDM09]
MASKNPYQDLHLDMTKVEGCLLTAGATEIVFDERNARELKFSFVFENDRTMLKLFPKIGGLYTIGKSTGLTAHFDKFAEAVKNECCVSNQIRLEFTTKLEDDELTGLFSFLESERVNIEELNEEAHCKVFAVVGAHGDKVRIKKFKNKSVQFQGRYLSTAILINDFLCNVLSVQDLLTQQIDTFKIPITKEQISAELLDKIPVSHDSIHEQVRKQLACSLALSKIDIELEDYSAISFPALRALEGYLFEVLSGNFKPENSSKMGEYFERKPDGTYGLTALHAEVCGEVTAMVAGECYTYWHAERHGTFHMSTVLAATRTISFENARSICNRVCELIETGSRRLSL